MYGFTQEAIFKSNEKSSFSNQISFGKDLELYGYY